MSGRRHQREGDGRQRTEPTLGSLDAVDARPKAVDDGLPKVTVEARPHRAPTESPKPRRRRRGWLLPVLALLLVAALAAAWLNQDHLRALLPRTDFNDVLGRAQQALNAGNLDGHDGTSARELFQQAVALEPDNDRANSGLHQVGNAELSRASSSLQAGQLSEAAQEAATARELLGGGSDVDRVDQAISRAQAAQVQTVDLVTQAQQALAADKLVGPDGAGALYQRVLRADPGNAVAAHGLDQVGAGLAMQARRAFDAGDRTGAGQSISELAALQPGNGALPALRAEQAQQQKQDSVALDADLQQGEAAIRAGRIAGVGNDTALAYFKAALAVDPANAKARAGLGDVAQALTVQANAAIDAGASAQATDLLDQAAVLAPKSADIAAARARLAARNSQPRSGGAGTPAALPNSDVAPPPAPAAALSPQQQAEVAALVQRAQRAAGNGDIMLPPGQCAYDLYRSALAIDGNSAAALAGLQGLPALVRRHFDRAVSAGQLIQANDMLDNLQELSPGDASLSVLADRLASAWLDQAEQRLNTGDRFGASHALQQAQKLEPASPRALDLAARLQGG